MKLEMNCAVNELLQMKKCFNDLMKGYRFDEA